MPKEIYIDGEDIKLVDGVQTTPRKLDEIVKGSHSAHKIRHQNAGADEINVGGLSGELADNQPPKEHKTSHQNTGGDEINVGGLSGLLADGQTPLGHKVSHQNGGGDEIDVVGLSGLLADGQTPLAHKTNHESGGADAIKLDDLSAPDDNTDLNASPTKHGLLPKMDAMIPNLDADKVDGKNASDLVQIAGVQTITGKKTFSDDIVFSGDKVIQTNVKARAYLSADQLNLTNNTWIKILLDAETYDVGADFDVANSKFVVPVTGYYLISGYITWEGNSMVADKTYAGAIYRNGAVMVTNWSSTSLIARLTNVLLDIAYLTVDDYIELYARQISGVDTVDIEGAENLTFLMVCLLSV